MTASSESILITGANGFVGSRMCRKFLDYGYHVIAGVRKNADLSLLEGLDLEFRHGDVTVPATLPDMVRGVDYVIHNAGVVKVKKPEMFFNVNQIGTRNLFEAIAQHNPTLTKAIYISSQAAAGPSLNGTPVSESDAPHPVSVYGESKLAGEREALSFADRFGVISVRPPGIYGPGDKELYDLFKTVYRRIKPAIGNQQRKLQLIHVDDLCEGIMRSVTADTTSGSVYFIAESKSYTMSELIQLLQDACGRKGLPLWIPGPLFKGIGSMSGFLFKLFGATPMLTKEKATELLYSWEVNTDKARDELGFESKIPFSEGARQTFDWYITKGWL